MAQGRNSHALHMLGEQCHHDQWVFHVEPHLTCTSKLIIFEEISHNLVAGYINNDHCTTGISPFGPSCEIYSPTALELDHAGSLHPWTTGILGQEPLRND
eukprot:4101290-Amphidinium_carterae.1